jgi:NTP pyrophosphatase (non-canonical NTP hydrolase)
MTPDQIPQELLGIVDNWVGKVHSRSGVVASCLAEVLTAHAVMLSGHELSREQIARHGKDRYPTPAAQYAKVADELGELGEALMLRYAVHHIHDDDGTVEGCPGCFADAEDRRVEEEFADVGLALYALGGKMSLDLIECMRKLVCGDTRTFA